MSGLSISNMLKLWHLSAKFDFTKERLFLNRACHDLAIDLVIYFFSLVYVLSLTIYSEIYSEIVVMCSASTSSNLLHGLKALF